MGIDVHIAKFLLAAKTDSGVSFRSTATIGHQHLHVTPEALRSLLSEFGMADARTLVELESACGSFADPFLRRLGAEEIVSLDASDYENATVIHDMNLPVPAELKNRFDVVYDGGSLEHIFNFPVAVRNCMEMVRVGGHFLGASPANNWCGHGFYQFSPELYFRVFSPENGFVVKHAMVYDSAARWYQIEDPAKVRQRVLFASSLPVILTILAEKTAQVPVLQNPPQQSDYSIVWHGKQLATDRTPVQEQAVKRAVRRLVTAVEQRIPASQALLARIRAYRYCRGVARAQMSGLHSPYLKPVTNLRDVARPDTNQNGASLPETDQRR